MSLNNEKLANSALQRLEWNGKLRKHASFSYTDMLTESRQAKDWLRPPTRSDHWFWLVALPAISHCSSKFVGSRLVAHDVRKIDRSSFLICVALRPEHGLSYIISDSQWSVTKILF